LLLGAGPWQEARNAFFDYMADDTGASAYLARWNEDPILAPGQALLTAIVITADWIASNSDLFPYQFDRNDSGRAIAAWRTLNLPSPWRPVPAIDPDALVNQRFTLPPNATARSIQR